MFRSYLKRMALDHNGHVTVQPLQPLLVQTLQNIVAKVWDRHLEGLGHCASTHTTKGFCCGEREGEGAETNKREEE